MWIVFLTYYLINQVIALYLSHPFIPVECSMKWGLDSGLLILFEHALLLESSPFAFEKYQPLLL